MKKKKENLIVKDYSKDVYEAILNKSRHLFLYNSINNDKAEIINKQLIALAIEKPKVPIMLEINSGGGSVTAGLSIIDTIKTLSCPVYTVVSGIAASMATFISIVGSKRFMMPNAYWMAHPMSAMRKDYLGFLKDSIEWMKKMEKRVLNLYEENTNLPYDLIEKCTHNEVWLDSKQCKKYGVIDKIITRRLIIKG